MNGRRLWAFRLTALLGSVALGTGAGWLLWRAYLSLGPSSSQRAERGFADLCKTLPAESRTLLDLAGYGPGQRLVRTANFDSALVFSGRVMEPHAERGYRFRPSQQNLWVRPPELPYQVLVPDTEPIREALARAKTQITSTERINSLGCRGAESADPASYQFRVLVLGDSFVEGILVDEPNTLCACLERQLTERAGRTTLVVNAGVIGYSTEQEYHTLRELAPRFRPHVAVLCFYANDVHHDQYAVLRRRWAVGDWDSARIWLERCAYYCRVQDIRFVLAVVPDWSQLTGRSIRLSYHYRLEAIAAELGIYLIDPDERFLAHRLEPLWLEGDAHLAPAGHALFAQVLAEHLQQWVSKP